MAKGFVLKCSKCGKRMKADEQHIGRKGKCPNCGAVIQVAKGPSMFSDGTEAQVVEFDELETRKGAMLKIGKQNDVGVVTFATSRILDQSNVQQLGEELDELLDKHKLRKMVLNFGNISYMSSAVMGKLVSLHKKVKAVGGQVKLCGIASSIFEIFQIMRFDKLFDICESEDEAVIELMG